MKIRIRTVLLSVFSASLVIVSACGGNSADSGKQEKKDGKSVTITHAVNGDSPSRDKWIKAIGEKVGVNVDVQILPTERFEEIYKVKAGTRDLPDLINYHPGARTRDDLQASQNLVDLSDLPIVKNIFEDMLPYYQEKDGKVYGVPSQAMRFGGIVYNKKVFKEAGVDIPQSLDELIKVSEKIKKAGKTPFYLSGKDTWTLQIPGLAAFSYDQLQNKGILDRINANQASFTDAKNFVNAYKTLKTLLASGYVNSDYLSSTYANAQQAIAEGKAGMYPVLTSFIGAVLDTYPDKIDDLGFFAWPVEGEKAVTVWPPMIYGIPQESKHKDKVKEYIQYFASNEGQQVYFENQPAVGVPAYKGVELDQSKLKAPVKDMVNISNTTKKFATFDFSVVANIGAFGEVVQDVLMDQKTPEQLAETITDMLKKNAKSKGVPGF